MLCLMKTNNKKLMTPTIQVESEIEENVQHVDESEPKRVINVDGNVFLLYLI